MSSRSTPRRRKVVSTSHALDLLNNLNAKEVTHEPKSSTPYRPRSSGRSKINDDRVPRGDAIWDVPQGPDDDRSAPSKRVTLSEPLTPRRSSRLQPKSASKTTPSRKAKRRANLKLKEKDDREGESGSEPERESGGGSDNRPDEEAEEENTGPVEENQESGGSDVSYVDVVEDHGDTEFPQPVLDSPHNVPQSNRLSPFDVQKRVSALKSAPHGGPDESSDGSRDQSLNEPGSEYRPPRDHPSEQTDEPHPGSDNAYSAHEQQRSSLAVVIVNPATDTRSSMGGAESPVHSPESPRRTTPLKSISQPSPVQAESGDLADEVRIYEAEDENVGVDHTNIADEDESSNYIPTDDEAEDESLEADYTNITVEGKSSVHSPTDDEGSVRDRPTRSALFRYESDPEDLSTPPSKRRQISNQQPVSEHGRRSRERSTVTSRAVDSLNSQEDQTEPLQPRHTPNDIEQHVEDISEDDSENDPGDDTDEEAWLHQALKMAGQKNNWDTLVVQAHRVKKTANPSMAEYYNDFADLTSTLQAKYVKIVRYLDARREPRGATVRDCDELLNAILSDGTSSVDYIVEHKDDEPEAGQPSSEETLDEFEACLVSGMMGVLLACFEAYCKEDGLFPKAYEHLHRVLNVFLRLCYKIYCVVDAGYVDSQNRSRSLQLPLKKLIAALEKDLFKGSAPQPESVPTMSIKHGRPWTDDEGYALIDGLQRYQGRDRYARILKHFGERLRGRTIRGTREKARQLHDKLLPTVVDPDFLQTEEGRQQWYWLLSVREE
ncbi:conserved glutamic acid-rich protein [Aspergillus arachidicola]|uniref:Conserved glutamic acid-rich protein n=1 Tax=Aspergillus arachidicola TaxID=656916 RepID=A0A2G7EM92_9EURO|nr:conserved glutamic acid-rich protein [Aspergillus arachidicola]